MKVDARFERGSKGLASDQGLSRRRVSAVLRLSMLLMMTLGLIWWNEEIFDVSIFRSDISLRVAAHFP